MGPRGSQDTNVGLDVIFLKTDFNTIKSKSSKWKPIDRVELESFIGLVIRAGLHRNNYESFNDLWDISQSSPLYRGTMSLQRFRQFLQFLRFDDRQNRDKTDRLSPIRYIFELFIKQLPRHFVPSENLTVDEQLVAFRVDQLSNDVKQGRTITFDRYFTDIKLSEALLDRKMTSIGVVDYRRVFLPNELTVCRKKLFSSWFYFSNSHMLVSYQAKEKKKPIILLSSLHKNAETFDDDKELPCLIHDYNQSKYSVDVIDQCVGTYSVQRISRRWPLIVFYNMIGLAAINSMTLWLSQ
ncbi:unnamed protein product [Didymodactylos carnosus]|uniref:PiggyBac transposable element-derived protein domain-containing protein n=1 Tax=Didymodactylos carnosus TaxID=1234261 RepID=A0A815VJ26_9BILA|nr:unnamed protein product [Didymodactylos carnosus]CAF4393100.1 unnamed protein product [Didymodactylos carnosus]